MEEDKKNLKIARTIFNRLKTDPSSLVFAEELLDKKLLIKLKKSKYTKDKNFFKLLNLLDNNNVDFRSEDGTEERTDYVEKREIDHSTLYSFDGPFQKCMRTLWKIENRSGKS